MPQLDPLIGALVKHSAEALVLDQGAQPSLLVGGEARPVAKAMLMASQLTRLLGEIAPPDRREAVGAGQATVFDYSVDGITVRVEVSRGPRAVIRRAEAALAPPAAAAARPKPEPREAAPAPRPAAAPAPALRAGSAPLNLVRLFHTMVERGASDLHFCTGSPPLLRIDGELTPIEDLGEIQAELAERLLLEIAPERNASEFKSCGDTDFAYEIAGLCRFRCNLFLDRKGPGGVFRIIPTEIRSADDLGLSRHVQNLAQLTKGLVLVTGPTGSGKSTTLASLIDLVNESRRDHVLTIEDPIEFVHPNRSCLVNQREVHLHTQSFKKALRAALREDPDVVLVGELRDLETVAVAIETAETGHLVFGTLHTTSAVSTVDRIIDQFPADRQSQIRIMLSESLKGVIAQVLCKKIGGGRAAALEVLLVNTAVANLIREGKTFQIPSIMQTARAQGMVLLNDALLDLVLRRVIEPREAYLKAVDKANLVALFRAKGVGLSFLQEPQPAPQPA
jgi:twitching motility protein PilT